MASFLHPEFIASRTNLRLSSFLLEEVFSECFTHTEFDVTLRLFLEEIAGSLVCAWADVRIICVIIGKDYPTISLHT